MENLLDVIEQFLGLSDEKLEELADKNQLLRLQERKGKEECVNS
ncbi:SP_0009 family protein [Streptococcus pneumoniae]